MTLDFFNNISLVMSFCILAIIWHMNSPDEKTVLKGLAKGGEDGAGK
jgi:hypothetical protein